MNPPDVRRCTQVSPSRWAWVSPQRAVTAWHGQIPMARVRGTDPSAIRTQELTRAARPDPGGHRRGAPPQTPRNHIQRQVPPAPTGAAGHRRTVPGKPRQPPLTLTRPRTPPARAPIVPHLRPPPSHRWQRRPPPHHSSRLLQSTNRLWSRLQGGAHLERPQLHRGMLRRLHRGMLRCPRHRRTPPSQ